MSFDFQAFQNKVSIITQALPSIGNLVLAAQALAPEAAGLTKLGLVINTMVAAEPLFAGMEQMLAGVVSAVVTQYRSASLLPTTAPKSPSTP